MSIWIWFDKKDPIASLKEHRQTLGGLGDALKIELQQMIEEVENSDSITMDGKRALIEEYTLEIQILSH